MKKITWDSLFCVAVLIGIFNMIFVVGANAFEMLVILLLIHIVGQLQKKEFVNHTHHINVAKK